MHVRPLFVFLLSATSICTAQDSPFVAGFERFHRTTQDATAGHLLLSELNCTSCHAPGDLSTKSHRVAPDLRNVGTRADPYFLQEFILNPSKHQPGTTMPQAMNDLSKEQRTADAESIVHYLLSLGNEHKLLPPDDPAVARGNKLFHGIGCVACHAPEEPEVDAGVTAQSRQFPKLEWKYSHRGLQRFLANPLAVRPSGRMPHMNLNDRDASDIAHYLLRKTLVLAPLKYELFHGRRRNLKHEDAQLELFKTGTADGFDLEFPHRGSNYTVRLSGFIKAPAAGEYTFHLSADDGAQLEIGGELVVDNDSPRSTDQVQTGSGKITLEEGYETISVLYFQRGREQALKLEWEGPDLEREVVPPSVLTNYCEPVDAYVPWKVDKARAKQGEQLFAKNGCNNCHKLQPAQSGLSIPELASLDASNGCLAATPAANVPNYGFDEAQRNSLGKALASLKQPPTGDPIANTMTRLNCYACHERDKVGGVPENRRQWFVSDYVELGDEGRIPPSITNVGDKLKKSWLTEVLTNRGIARPYMTARMPQFDSPNVGHLTAAFVKADRTKQAIADSSDTPEEAKAVALRLIDKGKLQCISCHDFNGHESIGIRAMDLTTMPTRLNRDWFHRYMLNPSEYRPGTKMPASWPRGRSLFKKELDGDSFRQIDAIWTYLSDGRKAIPPKGLNRKSLELIVGGEAFVYRNKIREAGFRGICVGHPEQANLSFDAVSMRLTQIWKGRFLNVSPHWNRQGMGRVGPLGHDVITLPKGSPLAVLEDNNSSWPAATGREAGYRFKGYDLDQLQRPTFRYTFNGMSVADYTTATEQGEQKSLHRQLTVEGAPVKNLWLRLWTGDEVKQDGNLFRCGPKLRLSIESPGEPVVRDNDGQTELLVPIAIENGKTQLTVKYEW